MIMVGRHRADTELSATQRCTGTFSGGGGVLPGEPTGQQTEATGSHVIHWRDGRPVEAWHFGDWLGWLQRAGVLPGLG